MDEKQLKKMLNTAAQKLGMTPSELKSTAMRGDINSILSKMDKNSADKLKAVMKDKNLTDNIMNNFKNLK